MDAYSHLKAFRHPDVVVGIQQGFPTRLPHVELILADLCQQHCHFCAYRLEGYASNQRFDEKRMMPYPKAMEIVDDCAEIGVQAIQFTGGGEPTIYPQFESVVRRVRDRGMSFALVSNGVRITEELAKVLAPAAWVRISLDAATEETYCKTRGVHRSHWEKAQGAVRNLKQAGAKCVGVGFVVTPENFREVGKAAYLAKELGVDNFRISAQFSNSGPYLFLGIEQEAEERCIAATTLSDEKFKVYNRFSDRVQDLRAMNPEDQLCGYQFFTTYIGADLNVYRCCGYAYNDRGLVGSLKEQRFKDFWMSQARFDNQFSFDARGCAMCQFRRQNSALAYVLSPEPQMHEEFV